MSEVFDLVANLQVRAVGVPQVVAEVNRALRGAGVVIRVDADAGGVNRLNSSVVNVHNNLRTVATVSAQAASSFGALNAQASAANGSVRNIGSAAAGSTSQVKGLGVAARDAADFMAVLGAQAGLSARRLLAFSVATAAVYGFVSALKNGVSEAISFQGQMLRISQIATESRQELAGISEEITRVSTRFGASSNDLAGVAEQLKQTGLSAQEVIAAIEPLGKASLAPSFGDIVKTTQGAVAAMRQFGLETKDLGQVLGSVNAVANGFAVESGDIIEAVKRAGGTFKAVGGDLNEFIGLFTAVRSTTRESAESIATGLRTIFTRLQSPRTVEALKDLGVNLRFTAQEAEKLGNVNLTNQFVGAYEAVQRLSEGLKGLSPTDSRFSEVVENLGGFRQVSRALPLIQQFSEAQRATNAARQGGISLDISAEKVQNSLANAAAKTGQEFAKLFRGIVETDAFQSFAKSALELARGLAGILEVAKPLLPLLLTFSTIKLFQSVAPFFSTGLKSLVGENPSQVLAKQRAGTLSTGGAVPYHFATGGVVPGVGDTDSVRAVLQPGEFVVKKSSAKQIGYDALHRLNGGERRYASGGYARRYAAGDFVIPGDEQPANYDGYDISGLRKIVRRASLSTGIDFRKATTGFRLVDEDFIGKSFLGDANRRPNAAYNFRSGNILLSRIAGRSLSDVGDTSLHELTHGLDSLAGYHYGQEGGALSEEEGNPLSSFSSFFTDNVLKPKFASKLFPQSYQNYLTDPKEGLAIGLQQFLGSGRPKFPINSGKIQRSLLSQYRGEVLPFLSELTKKPEGIGNIVRPNQHLSSLLDEAGPSFLPFAGGGLADLSGGSSLSSLLESVSTFYSQPGRNNKIPGSNFDRLGHAKALSHLTLNDDIASIIPQGSSFLGSGLAGLAFRSPLGEVYRAQSLSPELLSLAGQAKPTLGKDRLKQLLSTDRPEIDGVLQALSSGTFGGTLLERLPFVSDLRGFPSSVIETTRDILTRRIGRQGYNFIDNHEGNFGFHRGLPTVIDPGAIAPALQSTDLYQRHATGGRVDYDIEGLRRTLLGASQSTGINFSKATSGIRLTSNDYTRGLGIGDSGFEDTSGGILIGKKPGGGTPVGDIVLHELTHGLDFLAGGAKDYATNIGRNPLAAYSSLYRDSVLGPQRGAFPAKDFAYLNQPNEGLAFGLQGFFGSGNIPFLPNSASPSIRKALTSRLESDVLPYLRDLTGAGRSGLSQLLPESGVSDEIKKILEGAGPKVPLFAAGGRASGSDSVPAFLTPGEYVLNRDAVSRIGAANLHRANATGDLSHVRGYANGGLVGFADGGQAKPRETTAERIIRLKKEREAQRAAFAKAKAEIQGTQAASFEHLVDKPVASQAAGVAPVPTAEVDDEKAELARNLRRNLEAKALEEAERKKTRGTVQLTDQQKNLLADPKVDKAIEFLGRQYATQGIDAESIAKDAFIRASATYDPEKAVNEKTGKPIAFTTFGQVAARRAITRAIGKLPTQVRDDKTVSKGVLSLNRAVSNEDGSGERLSLASSVPGRELPPDVINEQRDVKPLERQRQEQVAQQQEVIKSGFQLFKERHPEMSEKAAIRAYAQETAKNLGVGAGGTTEQVGARIGLALGFQQTDEKKVEALVASGKGGSSGGRPSTSPPEPATEEAAKQPQARRTRNAVGGDFDVAVKSLVAAIRDLVKEIKGETASLGGSGSGGRRKRREVAAAAGDDINTNIFTPLDFRNAQTAKAAAARPGNGVQEVGLGGLAEFAKANGLTVSEFSELVANVRKAAQGAGVLGRVMEGASNVLVELRDGVATVKGFVKTPTGRQDDALNSGIANRVQEQVARAAAAKEGVPYSDVDTKRTFNTQPLEELDKVQAGQRALGEARARQDEDNASKQRKRLSNAQITDPLELKKQALDAARTGGATPELLAQAKATLSPAQYAQVEKAYQQQEIDAQLRGFPSAAPAPLSDASQRKVNNATAANAAIRQKQEDAARAAAQAGVDFNDVVAGRAAGPVGQRLAGLGPVVSNDSKTQIVNQEVNKQRILLHRELISAEENLLKALFPEINAVEAHKIALENAQAALNGQTKVIRDSNGHVLGTAGNVTTAQNLGVTPPGAGGVGYGLSSFFGGAIGGVFGGIKSLSDTFNNSKLGQFLSRGSGLALPALIGGPLLAEGIANSGGTAADAVNSGNTGAFRRAQGGAGALSGLVLGATIGSQIAPGPFGAVIGGAIGALTGFISGLKEAERSLREARLSNALTEFNDKIQVLANTFGTKFGADPGFVSATNDSLASIFKENSAKATESATSHFLFVPTGFDAGAYGSLNRANLRESLGNQLPSITQTLSSQIPKLVRENPASSTSDVFSKLREGGLGLNETLLDLISQIRRVPIEVASRELRQAIETERRNLQNVVASGKQQTEVNAFGRLLLSTEAATDSLQGLQRKAQALSETFDSVVGATKIEPNSQNLSQLGRQDKGALEPLEVIKAVGGENGSRLYEAGKATDQAAAVLPGILATVASKSFKPETGEADFVSEVSSLLRKQLGGGDNQQIGAVIAAVTREINKTTEGGGLHGLVGEIQVDTTKFSEKLLAPFAEPLKEIAGRTAKLIEENANRYIESLTRFRALINTIGEGIDRGVSLQTATTRGRTEVEASRGGFSRGYLDRIPLSVLQAPDQARLERLTGLRGEAAQNPEGIGTLLRTVNDRIPKAVTAQQEAFQKSGGKGPGFEGAVNELSRLKDVSVNLQAALRQLADASTRNAAIQEKLSKIDEDKQSRLGFGERYISGDLEGRQQIERGLLLANTANNQKSLDNFVPQDQKLILDTLRGLGNAKLTGFTGQPVANDLADNLVKNFAGGTFDLDSQRKGEKTGLQDALIKNLETAQKAQETLVKEQKSLADNFFGNLKQQQDDFFTKMGELLIKDKIADVQTKISQQQIAASGLDKQKDSLKTLSGFGITSDEQIKSLNTNRKIIDRATLAKTEEDLFEKSKSSISDSIIRKLSGTKTDDGINQLLATGLTNQGFQTRNKSFLNAVTSSYPDITDKDVRSIEKSVRDKVNEHARKLGVDVATDSEGNSFAGDTSKLAAAAPALNVTAQEALRDAIRTVLDNSPKAKEVGTGLDDASRQLSNVGLGIDLRASGSGQQLEAVKNALENFGNRSLKEFGLSVENTTKSLQDLQQILADLKKGVAAPAPVVLPQALATGGFPGSPQGSDTIPAWLSPNEFVINPKSSVANRGLLHRINDARGPVYLADGGPPNAFFDDLKKRDVFLDGNRKLPEFDADAPELQKVADAAARQAANPEKGLDKQNVADTNAALLRFGNGDPFNEAGRRLRDVSLGQSEAGAAIIALQDRADKYRSLQSRQLISQSRRLDAGQQNIAIQSSTLRDVFNRKGADQDSKQAYIKRLRDQQRIPGQGQPVKPEGFFANGGLVRYLSGGGSADDTLIAAQTGEYILRRSAVERIGKGNLDRANLGHFATGGLVGGSSGSQSFSGISPEVQAAFAKFSDSSNNLNQSLGLFSTSVALLSKGLDTFSASASKLAEAMGKFPSTLTLSGTQQVNVTLSGAEALVKLQPVIKDIAEEVTSAALRKFIRDKLPDLDYGD